MTIERVLFLSNAVHGGEGDSAETGGGGGMFGAAGGGQNGGAIFALHNLNANENGNNQGMPAALPVITGCENTFSLNEAGSALASDTDNNNTFGTSQSALEDSCRVTTAPALSTFGTWLLGGLLAVAGWLRSKRRRRPSLG